MRFLLFCTFLSFSHCLIGQKWQPAEWIIFGAKRDSGWVRLPINGLKHATDIKLKSQSKHSKSFKSNRLVYLKTGTDTILTHFFFQNKHHRLVYLIKGEVSLYKELAETRQSKFYLKHNNQFVLIDKDTTEEAFALFANGYCKGIAHKTPSFFFDAALMKTTQKLNECIDSTQTLWTYKAPAYRWRYSWGDRVTFTPVHWLSSSLNKKRSHQFHIGLERKIGQPSSPLSYEFQLSYLFFKRNNIYNGKYNRKLKVSIINTTAGLKLELLPKRGFTPYIFSGLGISSPFRIKRELNLIKGQVGIANWPTSHTLKARLAFSKKYYGGAGFRVVLTPKLNLNLNFSYEQLFYEVDFSKIDSSLALLDLKKSYKNEFILLFWGFSLSRSFSGGI